MHGRSTDRSPLIKRTDSSTSKLRSNDLRVVAIIQARMRSTRLPGKVMLDIASRPMLFHVVDRVRQAACADEVIIATSDSETDQQIVSLARDLGVRSFAGSETDVLTRFVDAADMAKADIVIRVTGDCPLIDPAIIDETFDAHMDSGADYTGNAARRTLPRGLDVEIVSTEALRRVLRIASEPRHREHVTSYIYENSQQFRIEHFEVEGHLRRPDIRLTVDTLEDLRLVREIYRRFHRPGQIMDVRGVIEWLDTHPSWAGINTQAEQEHLLRNERQGIRQVTLPGADQSNVRQNP